MTHIEQKVGKLIRSSKLVLNDCVLENGSIVAVNGDKPYAQKAGNDYRYVWGRDTAFILYALNLLGVKRSRDFAKWLLERAEQFEAKGLYCRRYATHGAASFPHDEYQPDQGGTLLWSFDATGSYHYKPVQEAAAHIADALCASWHTDSFVYETYDLWEHHIAKPKSAPFLYSLASCATGLEAAARHTGSKKQKKNWRWVAGEMKGVIAHASSDGWYPRRNGDKIDASMSGLIWPFRVSEPKKEPATMARVLQTLTAPTGLHRFEGDVYNGVVAAGIDLNDGAGTWPLLDCWAVIALCELGQEKYAHLLFERLTERLDEWIPEQLLSDGRHGVSPLGWSHAMYVIAAHRLGYSLESKNGIIV